MLYLYIIGNICRVFSLKDTLLNKLTTILIKNIHPNPLKRETLEETCDKYNELFNETNDWSFMKDITLKKLENLYDMLQN
jgi:hypothetical protein